MRKNQKVLILLLFSVVIGALLAKFVPMTSDSGFSSHYQKTEKSEIKESSEKSASSDVASSSSKEKEVSYEEQINKSVSTGEFVGHLKIPLLLQTEDQWKDVPYGTGNPEGNTIGVNGCALTSLAMLTSFLDNTETTPQDILNWSSNDYYMEGEGTAWSIFSEFAAMKGYQYEDLGMDMLAVEEQLKQNHPVIISVKPGTFTDNGHIMVLSGTNEGNFWINDPNDTEAKGHSKKMFTSDELANEAFNFWTIYKA